MTRIPRISPLAKRSSRSGRRSPRDSRSTSAALLRIVAHRECYDSAHERNRWKARNVSLPGMQTEIHFLAPGRASRCESEVLLLPRRIRRRSREAPSRSSPSAASAEAREPGSGTQRLARSRRVGVGLRSPAVGPRPRARAGSGTGLTGSTSQRNNPEARARVGGVGRYGLAHLVSLPSRHLDGVNGNETGALRSADS
jgi:hypothetical protein